MNLDGRDSALNSHICFNALATLQHIKNVENSCNFCSSSDHSTYMCPVLSQGEHVKDTSTENLSRSSVPHGLQVYENERGTHIISLQKFAKGCRFGPLLAPKSYIPIANTKFPLTVFGTINLDMEAMNMPELKELFKVRHIHLDTRCENHCNWMIHVDPATWANEQNLVAYEEDNEIFFAAIEDLDVGDILKVWYSPKYGERMKLPQLPISSHAIVKNVLQQGEMILSDIQMLNGYATFEQQPNRTEILLPSIKNIIKPSSYVCYDNRRYNNGTSYPSLDAITGDFSNKMLDLDETFALKTDDPYNPDDDLLHDFEDEHLSTTADGTTNDSHANASNLNGNSEKDDKKIYPCQMCDKKYSTMTNIYRHVRTQHNYFLCSLCMNMFKLESDLKEHIHKCPKSDVKKPQCVVCMQYFSNSWSLTRHIKIHVSAGECDADILSDRKAAKDKKIKMEYTKDSIDLSDGDKASRDSLIADAISIPSEQSQMTSFTQILPIECEPVNNDVVTGIQMEKSESNTSLDLCGNENEISTCIVCDKRFKSKPCMNKHLRSVHTVKVLSGTKRSAAANPNSKSTHSQSKRSQSNDSQSTITHTGLPVNPNTAKALASKLNERSNNNNMNKSGKSTVNKNKSLNNNNNKVNNNNNFIGLKSMKPPIILNDRKVSINEIPVPPLVSIQMPQQRINPLINTTVDNNNQTFLAGNNNIGTNEKLLLTSVHRGNEDYDPDLNVPTFNIFKTTTNTATTQIVNGMMMLDDCNTAAVKVYQSDESTSDESKPINPLVGQSSTEKTHKCDLCGKKFNKKYELKRHKAVHENVTFTCPYCIKVVKRKPSIIKHLRISHKDMEHIWNQGDFIDNLKQPNYIEFGCKSDEQSQPFDIKSGNEQQAMGIENNNNINNIETTMNEVQLNTGNESTINEISNGLIAVNHKPKKSSAIISYLKKLNYNNVKKYLLKNNANNMTEQSKRNSKLKTKLQLLSLMASDAANGKLNLTIQNDHSSNINGTDIQLGLESSNKNNHTFDTNTPPSSPPSLTSLVIPVAIPALVPTTSSSSSPSVSLLATSNENDLQMSLSTNTVCFNLTHKKPASPLPSNHLVIKDNILLASSMESTNKSLMPVDTKSAENKEKHSTHNNNNNNNNTDEVQNIIDSCFFVDDTLNVGLNSPFSSDNDVDSFIMSNSNEDTTMTKELLNKFHDRLEEMEEKIDNGEFKLFWNEMSDDENINDDDIEDEDEADVENENDDDDDDNRHGNNDDMVEDETNRNGNGIENGNGVLCETNLNGLHENENGFNGKIQVFNEMQTIKSQINEFV